MSSKCAHIKLGIAAAADYGWGVEDLEDDEVEGDEDEDDGWGVESASPLTSDKSLPAVEQSAQQKVAKLICDI